MGAVRARLRVSERRACRVLGQYRSVQRRVLRVKDDEQALTEAIMELASQYGRYGYRRITALLHHDGWQVSHKRVERIWRQDTGYPSQLMQIHVRTYARCRRCGSGRFISQPGRPRWFTYRHDFRCSAIFRAVGLGAFTTDQRYARYRQYQYLLNEDLYHT